MHCTVGGTKTAKYLPRFNNSFWENIEPNKDKSKTTMTPPPRIRKIEEAKPKKEKKKDEKESTNETKIQNKLFSFTSFLIPICVTGERKDYQLLYCICALKNALKILSTTLRKEGFAQFWHNMHCTVGGTKTAKYLPRFNNSFWENIEPNKDKSKTTMTPPPRIRKIEEAKPKKEKKKDEKESTNETKIQNKLFSFTSFLIPICVTGERKDYQLLYCICALKNALKILSTTLRKEGFAQLYMVGMKSEVNWEKIKSNRVTFTDLITDFLFKTGAVCMVAADQKEVFSKVNDPEAPFIVILSATDVELPCREILSVGTSWLVFRRSSYSRGALFDREVYNCGRRTIHGGILVNGCSTNLIAGFKRLGGIHHFIYDPSHGDFILQDEQCYLRKTGNTLCLNEGPFYKFYKSTQKWLMERKGKEGGYFSIHTNGCISDGYRILRSGGLHLSPEDNENTEGRIKYLYKAIPLAFLVKKAGGKATDGISPISKPRTARVRIFTNLVLGSIEDVDNFMVTQKEVPAMRFREPVEDTDLDDTSTDID